MRKHSGNRISRILDTRGGIRLSQQPNGPSSSSNEQMTPELVETLEQEMKELELEMKQEVELIRALEDQKLDLLVELADIEKRRKEHSQNK